MSKCNCNKLTYYQRNRNVILNSAKDCYENDNEQLRQPARNKYRNLSKEEKIKRENTGKTDTKVCEKKKTKTKRILKKLSRCKKVSI